MCAETAMSSSHRKDRQWCGFYFIIAGGHAAAGRGQHSFGHMDSFELFRSFFGTGDPFNAFDHFGMHHHHPHHLNTGRTDPWYRRHLLAKRLRIFCPKISPESTAISADPKILQPLQRTTSCWLWFFDSSRCELSFLCGGEIHLLSL